MTYYPLSSEFYEKSEFYLSYRINCIKIDNPNIDFPIDEIKWRFPPAWTPANITANIDV